MPNYLSPGVYVEEVDGGARPIEGVGTAVAAFVGLAGAGPFNEPRLVTNWSQYVGTFGDFLEGTYLAHAVYQYFNNGGGACYVVRIGSEATTPDKAPARAELPSAASSEDGAGSGRLAITASAGGPVGNDITVEIGDATEPTAPEDFKLIVKRAGKVEETFDNLSTKRGKQNVATVVNAQSKIIKVAEQGGAVTAVSKGTVALAGGGVTAPSEVATTDLVGDSAARTGFAGLESVDDVTMLCVPDLMTAYQQGWIDLEGVKAVQLGMISHCELMGDRMAILDPPPGLSPQQIKEWRVDVAGYDSKMATLYWPWVKVIAPPSGRNVFVPP